MNQVIFVAAIAQVAGAAQGRGVRAAMAPGDPSVHDWTESKSRASFELSSRSKVLMARKVMPVHPTPAKLSSHADT